LAWAFLAASMAELTAGKRRDIRMPMMAITMRSSIRVKAEGVFSFRFSVFSGESEGAPLEFDR